MPEDNPLLERILAESCRAGDRAVVCPRTSIEFINENSRESLLGGLKRSEVSSNILTKLVDTFIHKNEKSVVLTLESKPEKGYTIDYKEKFQRWRQKHLQVPCYEMRVSLPADDEEHQLILIYLASRRHALAGTGDVILFKNEGRKLKPIGCAMMWIA